MHSGKRGEIAVKEGERETRIERGRKREEGREGGRDRQTDRQTKSQRGFRLDLGVTNCHAGATKMSRGGQECHR